MQRYYITAFSCTLTHTRKNVLFDKIIKFCHQRFELFHSFTLDSTHKHTHTHTILNFILSFILSITHMLCHILCTYLTLQSLHDQCISAYKFSVHKNFHDSISSIIKIRCCCCCSFMHFFVLFFPLCSFFCAPAPKLWCIFHLTCIQP